MKDKPIKYYLEIYEESFSNDVCLSLESPTPFMSFNKGDLIDPEMIFDGTHECPDRHWWEVTAIVHRVWETRVSDMSHQIGICVKPVPDPY